MTDEQLADEFFQAGNFCEFCQYSTEDGYCSFKIKCPEKPFEDGCKQAIRNWLKSTAKEK